MNFNAKLKSSKRCEYELDNCIFTVDVFADHAGACWWLVAEYVVYGVFNDGFGYYHDVIAENTVGECSVPLWAADDADIALEVFDLDVKCINKFMDIAQAETEQYYCE